MAVDTMDEKAQVDTAPLSGDFESLATQKVQLDIDDAPFLDNPEEAAAPLPAPVKKEAAPAVPAPKGEEAPKNKKKLIIGAGVVVLLAVAVAAYFLVLNKPEPPRPPIIYVDPPPTLPPPPESHNIKLDSFMVELTNPEGHRRFLQAAFIIVTKDTTVYMEVEDKTIILRDAVYYYLKNREYSFLHDARNIEKLRQELINAVNDSIIQGNIDDILFDTYIIR